MSLEINQLIKNLNGYEIEPITRDNYVEVGEVFTTNPEFCLLSEGKKGGAENVLQEIDEGPSGFNLDNKFFVSLRKDGRIIGILDLLKGFPAPDCMWIGLLMVHGDMHDRSIGSKIVKGVLKAARDSGHRRVQLGVIEANVKALKFWQKMGFEKIHEKKVEQKNIGVLKIIVMEREVIQ